MKREAVSGLKKGVMVQITRLRLINEKPIRAELLRFEVVDITEEVLDAVPVFMTENGLIFYGHKCIWKII